MSDIERVFARMGERHHAATPQQEVRSIPRKGRSMGSRLVEVVHLPARGGPGVQGGPGRGDFRLRAATWEDGFPAKVSAATAPSPAPAPAAAKTQDVVAHLMPAWTRTVTEPDEAETAGPAETAPPVAPARRRPRRAPPHHGRPVADPFDANGEGANCLRCGYLVEPAREKRGLMTCAACG